LEEDSGTGSDCSDTSSVSSFDGQDSDSEASFVITSARGQR
jgi:hypothetical protein